MTPPGHSTPTVSGLPLIKTFSSEVFPVDRLAPGSDLVELLSKILVTEYQEQVLDPGPGGRFDIGLAFTDEAVFNIVGLDGFALVFGGAGSTAIGVGMTMRTTGWDVSIGAGARLRFPRNFLRPVVRHGDAWVDDPSRPFAELHIGSGMVIDQDWNVSFDGPNAFRLDPAMIADSGLVLEGEIALDLSETTALPESTALGLPPTWRGGVFRSLQVHLPDAFAQAVPVESLGFTNFHIGTGGVTGTIALVGTPPDGALGGFPFRPTSLAIELKQSCLVRAEIAGRLALAFFDQPLDITAGFDLGGNLTAAVVAESGVVTLTRPGSLSLSVDGLRFAQRDGVFTIGVTGMLTPLLDGLDWPGFAVHELEVDSHGRIWLEGGWLDLDGAPPPI